jgi:hypothetical protein
VKIASAQSLKNASKHIYDFDFLEFSFLMLSNQKRISSKMDTLARSKDPDPAGSGLEKL